MKRTANRQIVKRILQSLRGERKALIGSFLFATVQVALLLWIPILTGKAVDCIIGTGDVDFDGLFPILLGIGASAVGAALTQWLMTVLNNRISYGTVKRMRHELFAKIQRLPLSYLDSHSVGDTVSRMINDADQFSEGLLLGFSQFFTGILTIAGTLAIMLTVSLPVAAVVILVTPLSLFVSSFIAKKTFAMFREQSKTRAEQTAMIDEYVGGHKLVLAFSQEDEANEAFREVNDRLCKCSLRATFFSSITNPSTRFVNNLVYAGVALVGSLLVLSGGGFTVGSLTVFLSYANQYTKPFNEISGVLAELQNALACAGRVYALLDAEELPKSEADTLDAPRGEVTFSDVAFSYQSDRRLITNFDLSVKPGQHVAIVGPTGCGKTTLINLLMRFYDVDGGEIRIDGKEIRALSYSGLRGLWGMVLQDTWLRAGTVRENILLGRPDATDEEMIDAAKKAHAHSFIMRLPNGYDTLLSENGGSLSQGQKQLLSIARVILCLPPMLILDEATSSIDTRMEMKIQDAFAEMMKGRTSFIVAHRLSTVQNADLILVMKEGKIVERGTHEELLMQNGFYAELFHSQFVAETRGD